MSLDELIAALRALKGGDEESGHAKADRLLLAFIANPLVTEAFEAIDKWYS